MDMRSCLMMRQFFWNSKKQTCIALSTMEAEFIACSAAVQEAVWLKCFLENLAIVTNVPRPVIVYCDI